jgi:3-dehydroquinate synthetase
MRVAAHLNRLGLPSTLADLPFLADMPIDKMVGHMRKDKKARDGKLTFILVRSIGQAFVEHQIDEQSLRDFLESCR